ncbi:MAG: O-antigen ligase family protein [Planctomycetota bacterium]|nr:O-antigen ligase family protein [Planctomycetota bacterium]
MAAGVALFAWLLASALWAPDQGAAVHKAVEVVLLAAGVLGLATAVWRGDARACRAGLLAASVCGLLVLAAAGLVASSETGRIGALGGGPNVFGRNMGVLMLLALAAWRTGVGRGWLPVAGVGGVHVLLSASRGALGSTLVGVAIFALLGGGGLLRRAAAPAAVALAAAVVFVVRLDLWEAASGMFRLRLLEQTLGQGNTGDREIYFRLAFDLLQGAPLQGVGLAGYPVMTGVPYPHNLPLEVASEAGLVGLALLLGVGALWAALLLALRPVDPVAISVWVVLFGSAQLSGDLYDSRGLLTWGLIAVAGGLSRPAAAPPDQGERGAS